MDLIINGITIPAETLGAHSQSYDTAAAGGQSSLTMGDGSEIIQTRWSKLTTTLRASGWAPPAVADLSPVYPVTLACLAPRSIGRATRIIPIPAARRTDVDLIAQATVGGRIVPTTVESLVDNTATLAAVPGATGYAVLYYPLILARVRIDQTDLDASSATYGWTLVGREA